MFRQVIDKLDDDTRQISQNNKNKEILVDGKVMHGHCR